MDNSWDRVVRAVIDRRAELGWTQERLAREAAVGVRTIRNLEAGTRPLHRNPFNQHIWHPAQQEAGIVPRPARGEKRAPARQDGMHALRHTAVSNWLRRHIDVVRVAAWIGDTPQMVVDTYAHLLPDDDDSDGRDAVDGFLGSPPCAPGVPSEGSGDAL